MRNLSSPPLLLVALTCSLMLVTCAPPEAPPEPAQEAEPAAPVAQAPAAAPEPLVLDPVQAGTAPENPYSQEQIDRGEYLVLIGGCNDCHTPWVFDPELGIPTIDMSRMLSGHPQGAPDPAASPGPGDIGVIGPTFTSFAVPFGVMYSMNLTPDIETGTGTWTEEMFLGIFRKGRHLGGDGRGVLPPMPWWWFRNMPDEDLIAVFAYLRSIPPIYNPVPDQKVPEEAIWPIRDGVDRWVKTLPQTDWAAASGE